MHEVTFLYTLLADIALPDENPIQHLQTVLGDYHRSTFYEAMTIRARNRGIYFETQLYAANPGDLQQFASVTRPPILVQPDGVGVPRGAGRNICIPFVAMIHAAVTHACDEIAHEAELNVTLELLRRMCKSHGELLSQELLEACLEPVVGACNSSYLKKCLDGIR